MTEGLPEFRRSGNIDSHLEAEAFGLEESREKPALGDLGCRFKKIGEEVRHLKQAKRTLNQAVTYAPKGTKRGWLGRAIQRLATSAGLVHRNKSREVRHAERELKEALLEAKADGARYSFGDTLGHLKRVNMDLAFDEAFLTGGPTESLRDEFYEGFDALAGVLAGLNDEVFDLDESPGADVIHRYTDRAYKELKLLHSDSHFTPDRTTKKRLQALKDLRDTGDIGAFRRSIGMPMSLPLEVVEEKWPAEPQGSALGSLKAFEEVAGAGKRVLNIEEDSSEESAVEEGEEVGPSMRSAVSLEEGLGETEMKKLSRILVELQKTEESYAQGLESLFEPENILEKGAGIGLTSGVISPEDAKALGELEQALRPCADLARQFTERMEGAREAGSVEDQLQVVLDFSRELQDASILKAYTGAASGYSRAFEMTEQLKGNRDWSRLANRYERRPANNRQPVTSRLISPIQRGPRYVLLAKELRKVVQEESFPELAAELDRMIEDLASFVDRVNKAM